VYEYAAQYDSAIEAYEEATKRNPEEPVGYHHLGLAYFQKSDKESALHQYSILQSLCERSEPDKACEHFADDLFRRIHE